MLNDEQYATPEAFVMDLLQRAGTTGVKVNQLKMLLQQRNYPSHGRALGMLLVKAGTMKVEDTYFKLGIVEKANMSSSAINIKQAAKVARMIVESQPGQTILKTQFVQEMVAKGLDISVLSPIERGRLILTAGLANTNLQATPDLENPENEICYTLKSVAFRNARAQNLPMMNGPHGWATGQGPKNEERKKRHYRRRNQNPNPPLTPPSTQVPTGAMEIPFTADEVTIKGDNSTFTKTGKFKVYLVPVGIVLLLVAAGVIFAPQIAKAFGG